MGCGCGTRANRWVNWLGFLYEEPDQWRLKGRRGTVVLHSDITQHHFVLGVIAPWLRLWLGRE